MSSFIISSASKYKTIIFHSSKNKNTFIVDKDIDIIHFHNQFIPNNHKSVIQYHSPPNYINQNFQGTKLVIAQYPFFFPEYYDCEAVRNIIDFIGKDNIYQKGTNRWNDKGNTIRIAYSPSRIKNTDKWHNKGYKETVPILERIAKKYRGVNGTTKVEIDIIGNPPIPHRECLQRKTRADIVIDECVTDSYHRSGLEGLAMGKLTICSLGEDMQKLLKIVSGTDIIPFNNIPIYNLYDYLEDIIHKGREHIIWEGKESRKWMEEYWHPQDIINEFINIYKNI